MAFEVKRSTPLFVLWAVVLIGLGYSCVTGKLDWQTAIAFTITLGLPSILGAKRAEWTEEERAKKTGKPLPVKIEDKVDDGHA